jgi:hypothetical protein
MTVLLLYDLTLSFWNSQLWLNVWAVAKKKALLQFITNVAASNIC